MISEKICGLKTETQEHIIAVLKKYPFIEKALLYGSRAKGNYKPGSDIDLSLQGKKLTTSDLLKIENELDELMLPYKIDVSIYHLIDNKNLTDHIKRLGIVFYSL